MHHLVFTAIRFKYLFVFSAQVFLELHITVFSEMRCLQFDVNGVLDKSQVNQALLFLY